MKVDQTIRLSSVLIRSTNINSANITSQCLEYIRASCVIVLSM